MPPDRSTLAVLLAALVVGSAFAVAGTAVAQTSGNQPDTPAPSNELTVVDLSAPDSVAPNSTVEVAATLANDGNQSVTESVEFRVGGAVVADERVTVAPGEQTTVTFAANTTGLGSGDVLHGVLTENDGAFATLTLSESFTVSDLTAPANATTGSTVTVEATVSNPNDFTTTQTVEFRFAGQPLVDEELTLEAGESQMMTIDASLEGIEPGTYVHGILTRDLGQLATIEVMPNPATVSMADQTTDGTTVVVENVTVPEGGFIAIHDASLLEGNVVGSVIGVSEKLEPGTHENVTITLFEVPGGPTGQNLTENQTLIAMPHKDTNDNDVYDFVTSEGEEDGPYVADGTVVTDAANVTVEMEPTEPPEETPSEVSMANQTTDGQTVVVENVTVPEGGFIAIHNASLLDGNVVGSVIGVSEKLEPGIHENVTITLFDVPGGPTGQNLTENQTLIAMPHEDSNDNDVYDFVTSEGEEDGPYVVDGAAVTDTANVTVEMEPTEPSEPASVSMANQTSNGTTVVVENVTVPDSGFIAIHNASLLEGNVVGSVIGVSEKLESGTHENVTVTLFDVPGGPTGQNLTENQTLIAMPHEDTNDNDVYDFVTSEGEVDGPYTADGAVVIDTANVTVEMGPTEPPEETPGEETPTEPGEETPTETPGEETPTPSASLGPAVAALL